MGPYVSGLVTLAILQVAYEKNPLGLYLGTHIGDDLTFPGDLDRLQRFWLSGACRPEKNERTSSKPLSLDQFMSAFILLSVGILLAGLSLTIEHFYCRYLQKHLAKKHSGGCCALVSLVSLAF